MNEMKGFVDDDGDGVTTLRLDWEWKNTGWGDSLSDST